MASKHSGGTKRESDTKVKEKTQQPRKYKVILHNDDFTTTEFVLFILEHIFFITGAKGQRIMMAAHQTGRGVIGTYSKEVAETKCANGVELARSYGFPLLLTCEPE